MFGPPVTCNEEVFETFLESRLFSSIPTIMLVVYNKHLSKCSQMECQLVAVTHLKTSPVDCVY